jgi:hemerythrin-like domain-containing protein
MSPTLPTLNPSEQKPLTNFSNCHESIVSHLQTFRELPGLLEPAARARKIAEDTLQFFRDAVFNHHAEEEKQLFPAVLANAAKGTEHDKVQEMIDALTAEHRDIEALWASLEPQLMKVAKGRPAEVDAAVTEHLVRQYTAHAKLEEDEFLPLSEAILGRNSTQMAALGLSLHMRHVVREWREHGMRGS